MYHHGWALSHGEPDQAKQMMDDLERVDKVWLCFMNAIGWLVGGWWLVGCLVGCVGDMCLCVTVCA